MKNYKQDLANVLSEEISTDIFDALNELSEKKEGKTRSDIVNDYIADALETIENYQDFDMEKLAKLDFDYIRDTILNEYADSMTSIYNFDLWKNASILQNWHDEAINELDAESIKERGLIGIFQYGEYSFYYQFFNQVIDALEKYINE